MNPSNDEEKAGSSGIPRLPSNFLLATAMKLKEEQEEKAGLVTFDDSDTSSVTPPKSPKKTVCGMIKKFVSKTGTNPMDVILAQAMENNKLHNKCYNLSRKELANGHKLELFHKDARILELEGLVKSKDDVILDNENTITHLRKMLKIQLSKKSMEASTQAPDNLTDSLSVDERENYGDVISAEQSFFIAEKCRTDLAKKGQEEALVDWDAYPINLEDEDLHAEPDDCTKVELLFKNSNIY